MGKTVTDGATTDIQDMRDAAPCDQPQEIIDDLVGVANCEKHERHRTLS